MSPCDLQERPLDQTVPGLQGDFDGAGPPEATKRPRRTGGACEASGNAAENYGRGRQGLVQLAEYALLKQTKSLTFRMGGLVLASQLA